ncbi:MAG: hypothetical protein QOE64_2888 [Frankiales bacterium]|jgi:hypothetical protein|nr:hypothetical protein [Frankiales bacterium]
MSETPDVTHGDPLASHIPDDRAAGEIPGADRDAEDAHGGSIAGHNSGTSDGGGTPDPADPN